jgi:FeS assembly SUF system regulator
MLKISKLTDYALLVMGHLAKEPETLMSATTLAESLHLPATTVSKILKMLAEAELVTSVRGAEGGYLLAKYAGEITVADVISAMEGDLALTECCESVDSCTINSTCTMRDNWRKINKAVHSMLASLTIIDMTKPLSIQGLLHGK